MSGSSSRQLVQLIGLPVLIVLLFEHIPKNVTCQAWEPPVVLVSTGVSSAYPRICCLDNTLHVVWIDRRDNGSYPQIYYKKSEDAGMTWLPGKRLSYPDDSQCVMPDITVSRDYPFVKDYIHVVWEQYQYGITGPKLTLCKSIDGGENFFSPWIIAGSSYAGISDPKLSATGTNVYIAGGFYNSLWEYQIGCVYSGDAGGSYTGPVFISDPAQLSSLPAIAATGSRVYLMWDQVALAAAPVEIFVSQSFDDGWHWEPPVFFKDPMVNSSRIDLYASDENCYMTWEDERHGSSQIYFSMTNDNGNSWSEDIMISENTGNNHYCPEVVADGNRIHIVWHDASTQHIMYRFSADNGNTWEPSQDISNGERTTWPTIAAENGKIYIVYQITNDGTVWDIGFRSAMDDFSVNEPGGSMGTPALHQNYPNPFHGSTLISFFIPEKAIVSICIYNQAGEPMEEIAEGSYNVGEHSLTWNAEKYSRGLYYQVMNIARVGKETKTLCNKMIIY